MYSPTDIQFFSYKLPFSSYTTHIIQKNNVPEFLVTFAPIMNLLPVLSYCGINSRIMMCNMESSKIFLSSAKKKKPI